jgi:hypothetical protein
MDLFDIHTGICDSIDHIIDKSHAIEETVDEEESFYVDEYIASWQDKLKEIFDNQDYTVYLRINTTKKCIRTKILSMTMEFNSNCCLRVGMVFDAFECPSRRVMRHSDMKICRRNNDTGSVCHLIDIVHQDDVHDSSMIFKSKTNKVVSFKIISDLNMCDTSLVFNVGYLDYDII